MQVCHYNMPFLLKNFDIAKRGNDVPNCLNHETSRKIKETRKSETILVKSFSGCGEPCDLIFLFGTGLIDKN